MTILIPMTLIPMTEPRSSANTDDVITVIGINTDDEETMIGTVNPLGPAAIALWGSAAIAYKVPWLWLYSCSRMCPFVSEMVI